MKLDPPDLGCPLQPTTWFDRLCAFPENFARNHKEALALITALEGPPTTKLSRAAVAWWVFKLTLLTLQRRRKS